jgi:hypothetical protein
MSWFAVTRRTALECAESVFPASRAVSSSEHDWGLAASGSSSKRRAE